MPATSATSRGHSTLSKPSQISLANSLASGSNRIAGAHPSLFLFGVGRKALEIDHDHLLVAFYPRVMSGRNHEHVTRSRSRFRSIVHPGHQRAGDLVAKVRSCAAIRTG